MRGEAAPKVLIPTLRRWNIYDVIESEAVSIPPVNKIPLAAFGTAVRLRSGMNCVEFMQSPVFNLDNHVAAEVRGCVAALKCFWHRLNRQNRELAVRHQLQDAGKIGAAVPGKTAKTFYERFFLAVAIQIAVQNRREAVQRLLPVAASSIKIRQIWIQFAQVRFHKRLYVHGSNSRYFSICTRRYFR